MIISQSHASLHIALCYFGCYVCFEILGTYVHWCHNPGLEIEVGNKVCLLESLQHVQIYLYREMYYSMSSKILVFYSYIPQMTRVKRERNVSWFTRFHSNGENFCGSYIKSGEKSHWSNDLSVKLSYFFKNLQKP